MRIHVAGVTVTCDGRASEGVRISKLWKIVGYEYKLHDIF